MRQDLSRVSCGCVQLRLVHEPVVVEEDSELAVDRLEEALWGPVVELNASIRAKFHRSSPCGTCGASPHLRSRGNEEDPEQGIVDRLEKPCAALLSSLTTLSGRARGHCFLASSPYMYLPKFRRRSR